MYDVSVMELELKNSIAVVTMKIRAQFSGAFESVYPGGFVPDKLSSLQPPIDQITITSVTDLSQVYRGPGFYVILSDRVVDENVCRLRKGTLSAIYRGECGDVRKRIQSHLFNALYNSNYNKRSSRYLADSKNSGKLFYEAHWPHCMKLDLGGPSGINIDEAPHNNYQWLVLVHKMKGSSQHLRQIAELSFDDTFGHPAASREARKTV